jgi:hypothetical protein
VAEGVDEFHLRRRWVHSHEEDQPGRMVFRPSDYAFPPSRGRQGFTLLEGGTAVVGGPGPDDRAATARGTWTLEGRHLQVHAPGFSGDFEIEEVDDTKFVVRR